MLQSYKTKAAHVQDMGLFTELAIKLAEWFGRVTYTSPWQNAFPSSKDTEVGEGIAEIERIKDIHEVIDETDLFVFPDTYFGPTQVFLQDIGKRVWGSRDGDELEIYRVDAKKHFKELGIPQGPYEVVKGIKKLRAYLQANDGKKVWVKIEETRGDTETFCVEGYELYKNKLDELEYSLGPKAEIMTFIVEDHLKGTIDIAIDTVCVDGKYPRLGLLGTEVKGECYICSRQNYSAMPPALTSIYDKLSDTLRKFEYRNLISLESRVKGSKILLGDPCCRGGSPPLELQINMIDNLPDIMWHGAEGELIEPEIPSKYGAELIIHSDWADKHPLAIDFPKEMRDKVKFRYNTEFDGRTWIMPQGAGPRIAAVVEHGNSLQDIIEAAKEDAGKINGLQIENFSRSFDDALDKIKQIKEWGIQF